MEVLTTRQDLDRWSRGHAQPVLAPTMGALHEGHASLIRAAADLARPRAALCLVTIFVNPAQFDEPHDFQRYPRPLQADLRVCERAGAGAVFAPAVEEVYPADEVVESPPLPPAATVPGLEDAARPGHFAGVCRVVNRLFRLTRPCAAVFGEKDWQQLQVIRQMTADGGLGIEIVPHHTLREPDGLAMSSRNVFLSPAERARALSLSRALCAAAGAAEPSAAEHAMRCEMNGAAEVDYAVVRHAASLLPIAGGASAAKTAVPAAMTPGPFRALVAARVGAVRLIDNAPWPS